ncbi:MAG: flagellar basal body protein [Fimbriimonadaceae bacterium]|nr:flagellar basal body protein [Fimbriimonadaceae bacterium]
MNRLFGEHAANLQESMDLSSRRFGVLSNNLANVNVPGYKRKDMSFAIQLDEAGKRVDRRHAAGAQEDPGRIRVDGSSVDLEKEVMALSETELRFQMLSEMSGRYFSGLKTVIREGR